VDVQRKGEKIEQDRETEVSKLGSYDESSKSKDGRPGGEQGMDQVSSCLSFSHITVSDHGGHFSTQPAAIFPNESPEPVFLNVYGAPELIPRNEFRQPM